MNDINSQSPSNLHWTKRGLIWGLFMFLIMEIAYPYFSEKGYSTKGIVVGIIVWTLAGLLYGYTMKKFFPHRN